MTERARVLLRPVGDLDRARELDRRSLETCRLADALG